MSVFDITAVVIAPETAETLTAWLTFSASAISSLAWPIAAIVLTLLLRSQIPGMLRALKRFKGLGIEAEFEREVDILAATTAAEMEAVVGKPEAPSVVRAEDEPTGAASGDGEPVTASPEDHVSSEAPSESLEVPEPTARFSLAYGRAASGGGLQHRRQSRLDALDKVRQIAVESPAAAVLLAWREVESALIDVAEIDDTPPGINVWRVLNILEEKGLMTRQLSYACRELQQLRNKAAHDRNFEPEVHAVFQYLNIAGEVINNLYARAKLPKH